MRRATQPAKPNISIYDFIGLTADIFTELANWLTASLLLCSCRDRKVSKMGERKRNEMR